MAMQAIALKQPLLTDRWNPLLKHQVQLRLINDTRAVKPVIRAGVTYLRPTVRFVVVPAGRRSGKTEIAKRQVIITALKSRPGSRFFFAAPTRDQAKTIYWKDLKDMVPRRLRYRPLETPLSITLLNGTEIRVVGMDQPARIEGSPWDGGVLDEYGNMTESTWQENVRPMLAERHGFCMLIGVPEGRNHYFDRWEEALNDDTGEWGAYTWWSEDILDPLEVEALKRDMDELTFRQEMHGEFVSFVGQAYYPFNREVHCGRLYARYNPDAPLILMFDFNVDPGICAVGQEMQLPIDSPIRPVVIDGRRLFGKEATVAELTEGTGIIGEVHIPVNSNTPAVCNKLIEDWGSHRGRIHIYGDATGGARGSAQTEGSDWDLVKTKLYGHFGPERVHFEVPEGNPTERSRINAVNSRLMSKDETIRMMIDPVAAPNVVRDFEGVRLLAGGSGEIDKKRDPKLSHLSDGIGYYIVRRWPIRREVATSTPLRI